MIVASERRVDLFLDNNTGNITYDSHKRKEPVFVLLLLHFIFNMTFEIYINDWNTTKKCNYHRKPALNEIF